jgi:lysozyme
VAIEGIDVSTYQGSVDWSAVRDSGRRFVFVKATEGTTLADAHFTVHWAGAQEAGLLRGAYHFGHPGRDAATQAVHFFSRVGALGPGDLPPVLDLEENDGQSNQVVLAWTQAFLDKVEELFGCTAIVYTGGFWKYTLGNPSNSPICTRPLWLAQYSAEPSLPNGWPGWTFWQYSATASVPGVRGDCDVSRFAGDDAALAALAQLAPVPTPAGPPNWSRYFVWPATPMISGPDVAAWQAAAAAKGYSISVDGRYGPASRRTCMDLQRNLGLNVDGIVGPKTWAATVGQ